MYPVLYKAIAAGDFDVLVGYSAAELEAQVTPNSNTILHIAAQFGQTVCLRKILEKCGRTLICRVNIKGETPLHISAREGSIDIVNALIAYSNEVDDEESIESGVGRSRKETLMRMKNGEGETALFEAVRSKHLDVVEILTREDPEFVHPPNNANETPLFLAAERNHSVIVSRILENCKSQCYSGPDGKSALHAAVIYHPNECIRILHSSKPSLIKEGDIYGWRPLHYAAWRKNVSAAVQLLDLDNSVGNLAAEEDENKTALHIAARYDNVKIMNVILSYCPDSWEMINSKGQNILHLAVHHKCRKVIKFISEKPFLGSIVNQKDKNGDTPIHLCIFGPTRKVYLPLIKHTKADNQALNSQAFELDFNAGVFRPACLNKPSQEAPGSGNDFESLERVRYIEEKNKKYQNVIKFADSQLIVATLIATVTFAAGFTIPGGYDSNHGPKHGMAFLIRQAAFIVFVLADTIGMVFSLLAVFILLFSFTYIDEEERAFHQIYALGLILVAMTAMLVAFMTDYYAVLENTPGLAITVIVICCFFFPISWFVLRKRLTTYS